MLLLQKRSACFAGRTVKFIAPYQFMSPGLLYPARFIFTSKTSVKWFLADVGKENMSF